MPGNSLVSSDLAPVAFVEAGVVLNQEVPRTVRSDFIEAGIPAALPERRWKLVFVAVEPLLEASRGTMKGLNPTVKGSYQQVLSKSSPVEHCSTLR
jgi:hypothetical protein